MGVESLDVTEEFESFFEGLERSAKEKVNKVIEQLTEKGASLGYPYSSALQGATIAGLRELRVQYRGDACRVIYWISSDGRQVILLCGFWKDGQNEDRLYRRMITQAEALYSDVLSGEDDGGESSTDSS